MNIATTAYTITALEATRPGTLRHKTIDAAPTLADALDSARCEVNGTTNGYTVYVFGPDRALVARVQWLQGRHFTGSKVTKI